MEGKDQRLVPLRGLRLQLGVTLLEPFVFCDQKPLSLKDRFEPLAELPLEDSGQFREQGLQLSDLLLRPLQLLLALGEGRLQVLVLQRPANKKPPGT